MMEAEENGQAQGQMDEAPEEEEDTVEAAENMKKELSESLPPADASQNDNTSSKPSRTRRKAGDEDIEVD